LRELHAAALERRRQLGRAEMPGSARMLAAMIGRLDVVKPRSPRYFSAQLSDLPPPYWQALFPKPYWRFKAYAAQNRLDPYLVAALVRQESAFNPARFFHANAVGLMQVPSEHGSTRGPKT